VLKDINNIFYAIWHIQKNNYSYAHSLDNLVAMGLNTTITLFLLNVGIITPIIYVLGLITVITLFIVIPVILNMGIITIIMLILLITSIFTLIVHTLTLACRSIDYYK